MTSEEQQHKDSRDLRAALARIEGKVDSAIIELRGVDTALRGSTEGTPGLLTRVASLETEVSKLRDEATSRERRAETARTKVRDELISKVITAVVWLCGLGVIAWIVASTSAVGS